MSNKELFYAAGTGNSSTARFLNLISGKNGVPHFEKWDTPIYFAFSAYEDDSPYLVLQQRGSPQGTVGITLNEEYARDILETTLRRSRVPIQNTGTIGFGSRAMKIFTEAVSCQESENLDDLVDMIEE